MTEIWFIRSFGRNHGLTSKVRTEKVDLFGVYHVISDWVLL